MADINEVLGTDIQHKDDFVKKADPSGDLETISGLENYKQAMIRRWMTSLGTLLHRPLYGGGLKDFQNAPNTLSTRRQIAQRIEQQALRDERTAKVNSVGMDWNDETPELTIITVSLKPKGYEDTDISFVPFVE